MEIRIGGTRGIVLGRKIYIICGACQRMVRWNKPVIGDLHFCVTEEECKHAISIAEGPKGFSQGRAD